MHRFVADAIYTAQRWRSWIGPVLLGLVALWLLNAMATESRSHQQPKREQRCEYSAAPQDWEDPDSC